MNEPGQLYTQQISSMQCEVLIALLQLKLSIPIAKYLLGGRQYNSLSRPLTNYGKMDPIFNELYSTEAAKINGLVDLCREDWR